MGNFVYNQSKGKVAEYANRINTNDPANSVFVIEAIASTATDATLIDLDDFAAIEADANTAEVTQSGYARKTINDASGMTITIDDTNDRTDVDTADQTWTAVASGGSAWTDLVFGLDLDSTAGTDSAIKPCTQHDFAITTDGSDITATIAVFFRAS
jgi:hypothetical protein